MSSSILKEVSFTPQSIEWSFISKNSKRSRKLPEILDDLTYSGIIVSPSSQWLKYIYESINDYKNEEDKKEIKDLLELLTNRNKIATCPIDINDNSENSYIEEIKKINSKRELDFIAATYNDDLVSTFENIAQNTYKYRGGQIILQNIENIEKTLSPILAYTEIVKIYDPYFDLKKDRYYKIFKVICDKAGNLHSKKNNIIIEIHTSVQSLSKSKNDKSFYWKKTEEWQNKIKDFEEKYEHTSITIKVWEDLKEKDQWHDRWIITDQCGISLGHGVDESKWTDSTWSLVDWTELPKIEEKFNTNVDSGYSYIGMVTSDNTEQRKKPKSLLTYKSAEQKIVKNFHKKS